MFYRLQYLINGKYPIYLYFLLQLIFYLVQHYYSVIWEQNLNNKDLYLNQKPKQLSTSSLKNSKIINTTRNIKPPPSKILPKTTSISFISSGIIIKARSAEDSRGTPFVEYLRSIKRLIAKLEFTSDWSKSTISLMWTDYLFIFLIDKYVSRIASEDLNQ